MQSTSFNPVPYAVGGVARYAPRPVSRSDYQRVPLADLGQERDQSMFFAKPLAPNKAEEALQLSWEQAMARTVAKAYAAPRFREERGSLFDLPA